MLYNMKNYFKIVKKSGISKARLTDLTTAHGAVRGPFFMTIATRGAVKNVSVDEMKGRDFFALITCVVLWTA